MICKIKKKLQPYPFVLILENSKKSILKGNYSWIKRSAYIICKMKFHQQMLKKFKTKFKH